MDTIDIVVFMMSVCVVGGRGRVDAIEITICMSNRLFFSQEILQLPVATKPESCSLKYCFSLILVVS